jgi:uncharacterized protein YcfJ
MIRTAKRSASRAAAALALLALLGCAKPYEPAVDMTGHSKAEYDNVLLLCRENAEEMDVLRGVVPGAVAGAALGAASGALLGSAGSGAATGVGAGAIAGGAAGSAYGPATREMTGRDPHEGFVRDCLRQHGYKLLDEAPAAPPASAGGAQP